MTGTVGACVFKSEIKHISAVLRNLMRKITNITALDAVFCSIQKVSADFQGESKYVLIVYITFIVTCTFIVFT